MRRVAGGKRGDDGRWRQHIGFDAKRTRCGCAIAGGRPRQKVIAAQRTRALAYRDGHYSVGIRGIAGIGREAGDVVF